MNKFLETAVSHWRFAMLILSLKWNPPKDEFDQRLILDDRILKGLEVEAEKCYRSIILRYRIDLHEKCA